MSPRSCALGGAMVGMFAVAGLGLMAPAIGSASPSATTPTPPAGVYARFAAPARTPMDPPVPAPTSDELSSLLYSLADPGVSALAKSGLVEGGIGPIQAVTVDRDFGNANRDGYLPLQFAVSNVQSTGSRTASATVTISGPRTSAHNTQINFVDQDGWKISRTSAIQLINAASGR